MAPLYKRYVPAKSTAEKPATPVKPVQHDTPESATSTTDNKRKRERSQEEVLERKAKKLKKKGVDPETVSVEKLVEQNAIKSQDASLPGAQIEVVESQNQEQRLPMKKRHKLEKEARKARKAAEKDKEIGEGPAEVPQVFAAIANEQTIDEAPVIGNGGDSAIGAGEDVLNGAANHEDEETEVKVKRKKRRKESEGAAVQVPEEPVTTGNADPEAVETTSRERQSPEEGPKAKKRRHKLEHILEGSTTGDANAGDDEHLRKHSSVLGKFQKSASRATRHQQEDSFEKLAEHQVVPDLELPPPERTPTPEFETEDAALPSWLAKPTFVTGHSKATFRDLNIEVTTADRLSKLGFAEALPVQQALVPLLLPPGISGATYPPGTEAVLPDVAVSAPTGSGKTIAYLLPMIEALRHQRQHGKLSALIVVPTRELVMQVAAVAESLVKGSSIKVGMATGTGRFKDEQEKITTRHAEYDPTRYQRLVDEAKSQIHPPDEDSDEFESLLDQSGQEDNKRQQWIQETVSGLVDHIPRYHSGVDILVATPGRLLEHIDNTLGFNLVHLQWLVLDEADKLLDNQNEGFLESLNAELTRPRNEEEQDARERYLRSQAMWDDRKERRLRKVVLSATMTRDISKLTSLNLRRPKMIVVRGGDNKSDAQAVEGAQGESGVKESADGFELPPTLIEYCVPVGDGSEKPLVIVELLKSKILGETNDLAAKDNTPSRVADESRGSDIDSDSDTNSDSDDSSTLSSDSDSSSSASDSQDSEDDDDDDSQQQDSPVPDRSLSSPPARSIAKSSLAPTILIFTSSNESATRLTHLLQKLQPTWKPHLTTLLKTNAKPRIRSKPTEPAIVISTDRAARGLDAFSNRPITHVVQYDVPRTLTSYVHRVGRTARAGREGDAWTLYTHAEARWFVNEVTKAQNVSRRTAVERVKVFMADDKMREKYQTVLAGMRDEVFGAAI